MISSESCEKITFEDKKNGSRLVMLNVNFVVSVEPVDWCGASVEPADWCGASVEIPNYRNR